MESELDTYPIEVFQVRLDSRLKQDNSDNDDSDDSQSSDSSYSDSSSDEEEVRKDKNTRSTKKKSDFDFSRRNQPFNGIDDSLQKLASSYKNDNRYKKKGHEQEKGTEKEKAAEAKEEKEDEEAIDIAPPHFLFETDNTINNISNNIINKDIPPSIFDTAVPDMIVSAPQNNFAVSSLGDKNITIATNPMPMLPSNNSIVMDNIDGSEFVANMQNFGGDSNLETFDI